MDQPQPRNDELARLAQLARSEPERLGEHMAEMPVRRQADLVLSLDTPERAKALLNAPKPMRLVRALPDAELYLTVRELGPADGLPLISLASASQLLHLIDLESWRGDRFDPERSGAWVALMLEAGEPTLRRFLRAADDDLLTTLVQRWMRPRQIEMEDGSEQHGPGHTEAGTDEGFMTPDGHHLVTPTIAEHAPAVQRILQMFFQDGPKRYQSVLWSALVELPSELEERALHWRQSRLEEHGFPGWDDALAVYAAPAGVRSHPDPPVPQDPDGVAASRAPFRLLHEKDPLSRALDALTGDQRERALHELIAVANRLLVADGADTGDPRSHREAMRNVAGYVAIALQARGALRAEPIRETIGDVPLIELFREGFARAVELQTRARDLTTSGWASENPRALELLEVPIRLRLEGLLQARPLYHVGPGESEELRPFRTPAEIEEVRATLDMAEMLGRLMTDRLGVSVTELFASCDAPEDDPSRFSTVLLTALAWHAIRGELRGDPLPDDVASSFVRNVASRRTAPADAAERAAQALTRELATRFELSTRDAALLGAFARACVERLTAECGGLDPGVPIDPQVVSCLLVEH